MRTVKVASRSGGLKEYVRIVKSHREHVKVKQRVAANLGPKHLLEETLPKLERVLRGSSIEESVPADVLPLHAWNLILTVRRLFDDLGLWNALDRRLCRPKKPAASQ